MKKHEIENAVKDPDQVQSLLARLGDQIAEHIVPILAFLGLGAVVWLGFIGWGKWMDAQEAKAQEAYYAVESRYTKIREGFDKAKYQAMMPLLKKDDKDKKDEAKPATGDLQKDYGDVLVEMQKIVTAFPKSAASAEAAITLADVYLEYKQPDKAVEALQAPAKELPDNMMIGALVKVMLGKALADKGDCGQAIEAWKKVTDNKKYSFLHGDLALKTGICYEILNQPDMAKASYQKASQEHAGTMAGQTAKSLLRALEMRAKAAKG